MCPNRLYRVARDKPKGHDFRLRGRDSWQGHVVLDMGVGHARRGRDNWQGHARRGRDSWQGHAHRGRDNWQGHAHRGRDNWQDHAHRGRDNWQDHAHRGRDNWLSNLIPVRQLHLDHHDHAKKMAVLVF